MKTFIVFCDSDIYIFNARMWHKTINTNMEVTLVWFAITGTWKCCEIFSAVQVIKFRIMCRRAVTKLDQEGAV